MISSFHSYYIFTYSLISFLLTDMNRDYRFRHFICVNLYQLLLRVSAKINHWLAFYVVLVNAIFVEIVFRFINFYQVNTSETVKQI